MDINVLRFLINWHRVTADMHTGTGTLEILDHFGKTTDKDHRLICNAMARAWQTIHPDDRLSAYSKTQWMMESGRNGWTIRTESYA